MTFDLDRLRRNWASSESPEDDPRRTQFDQAVLPIDFASEVPRQLRALRESCEIEFSGQMAVLDRFLKEVESAGASLLQVQSSSAFSSTTSLAESDAKQPVLDEELTSDSFSEDPQSRLMGALSSLEDLLEVFMTAR